MEVFYLTYPSVHLDLSVNFETREPLFPILTLFFPPHLSAISTDESCYLTYPMLSNPASIRRLLF
jgi:hypothetical protein